MKKHIDLNEYMPVVIELINQGKEVPIVASGNSMTPFLVHQRDTIFVTKAPKMLRRGDMVFYKRATGQYVMHRIHHINKHNEYFITGDAHSEIEGPIRRNQIFGCVKKVVRKNKIITDKNLVWKFFSIVWIRIVPLRHVIIKTYTRIRKKNNSFIF